MTAEDVPVPFSRGRDGERLARLASASGGRISSVRPRREKTQSTRLKLARLQAVNTCSQQADAQVMAT